MIKQFSLASSDQQRILHKDCDAWRDTATEDSDNKGKSLYAKAHKGIALRLMLPFAFFYLRKEFSTIEKEEDLFS